MACGRYAVARIQGRPRSLAFEHSNLLAQSEDLQRGIASCTEENTESTQHSEEELDHEILVVTRRDAGRLGRFDAVLSTYRAIWEQTEEGQQLCILQKVAAGSIFCGAQVTSDRKY